MDIIKEIKDILSLRDPHQKESWLGYLSTHNLGWCLFCKVMRQHVPVRELDVSDRVCARADEVARDWGAFWVR